MNDTSSQNTDDQPSDGGGVKKKSLNPLAWVGIGCGALAIIVIIGLVVVGIFVKNKVKQVIEVAGDNPAKATATMIVGINPDLEMVSSDDEAGTMTIKVKSSGETVTLHYDDISEGKFTMETSEGTIKVNSGSESGTVAITDAEGKKTVASQSRVGISIKGADGSLNINADGKGAKLPEWCSNLLYPSIRSTGMSMNMDQNKNAVVMTTFETDDDPDKVAEFYKKEMAKAGLSVNENAISSAGTQTYILNGKSDGKQVTATVSNAQKGGSTVILNCSTQKK